MRAIENCRSSALGCHVDRCDNCGYAEVSYNSCRDRHCPKCQGQRRRKWVNERMKDLLPVPYYHVVFTLPDAIFPLCLFNQKVIYDLLFDASAETLLAFGRDDKWIGGEIGFFGILHTWGQTTCMHPHIHFVVPGGGIDPDGCWVPAKHTDKFLFPVHALSRVFRAKFIAGLKQAYNTGQLVFPGELAELASARGFMSWIGHLCSNQWITYAKPPFGDASQVVNYLGRYTHRVAISNHRIRSIEDGQIVFTYRDYADGDKVKELLLPAHEFIRRFLYHVLPPGFHKIRHYGFMANGRRAKLRQITEYLSTIHNTDNQIPLQQSTETASCIICPVCGNARLCFMAVIPSFPTRPTPYEFLQTMQYNLSVSLAKGYSPII